MTCRNHAHSWKITSYAPIEECYFDLAKKTFLKLVVSLTCKKCGLKVSGKLTGWPGLE